ncbi:hypothetical protein V4D30_05250 [Thermodesulfovibrio sp. 3907-1M]|uniref:DUF1887 family protein n=1 Tax=Thermodesulfovibrio autotrophicus TaxID=3118333 RepID=A0AAU8GT29_9BACT
MNDIEDIKALLNRIAKALETIADYLNDKQVARSKENKDAFDSLSSVETDKNKFVNDFSEIEEFLNSKNIRIKSIKEEEESDEILDKIALFMGDRYSHIKNLYQHIKRDLNKGRSFTLDLRNHKQEEIASITQLCSNLHQIAFLEEYKYYKSPKYTLYAKVNRIPKAINFFTGGWLERYVKSAVIEAIKSISHPIPVNYSYLKNPQIILPNGDNFELDIIFKIEDEYFWFEAKTGDYQRYIDKYSKVAEILKLDYEHAYMILTDITEAGAKALFSLFKMSVIRIDDFYETFKEAIQHLKPQPEEELGSDEQNNEL